MYLGHRLRAPRDLQTPGQVAIHPEAPRLARVRVLLRPDLETTPTTSRQILPPPLGPMIADPTDVLTVVHGIEGVIAMLGRTMDGDGETAIMIEGPGTITGEEWTAQSDGVRTGIGMADGKVAGEGNGRMTRRGNGAGQTTGREVTSGEIDGGMTAAQDPLMTTAAVRDRCRDHDHDHALVTAPHPVDGIVDPALVTQIQIVTGIKGKCLPRLRRLPSPTEHSSCIVGRHAHSHRRSPRWRPPTPDGKRRAPSPSLPKAKRARDYSPPRRRSPSRGRSTSRSVTPPRRRASSSPRSTNGRADRGRSPESPRTLSSQPAARSRTGGSYQERDQSDRGSQESSQSRNRPDPRQNRDRWQPVPPRGPRDSQPFGRQTVAPTNNPPFSQTADGPVKMRKWGAAANSRSPSPVASLPNVLQRPGTSPAQAAHSASQPQPPRGPAAQEAAVPPGFKRPPPTGPRRADPPTGPANGNGNTSPSKSNSAWRPIQQAPATDAFKQAITGGPVGRQVSSQSVTSEARATDSTDVRNTPRPVLSPRRSDKWSPDKWSPSKGNASLRSAAYLDRLADKERQYDQHLSTVAPYVTAAFTQWYSQNATPALTDFLVHYFGRRPSPSELDQIQHLLQRRTQLSHDQQELRNLHEQALRLESRPPPPHTSKGLPYDDPDPRPVSTSPQRRTAVHPAKQVAPSRQRAGPGEAYERLSQVGEGTYGKVYKARSTTSGVLVALKRIRMEQEKDGFPITSMREIKLLQALNHPNVLQLQEMMVSKGEYFTHALV